MQKIISSRLAWTAAFLLTAINTYSFADRQLPSIMIPELKADKDGFTNNPIFKKKNSNDLFDFEEYSRYKHHEQSRKYKKTFRPSIVFRDVDE